MARILVLNGPNLNLLGTREPELYGSGTLTDLVTRLQALATGRGVELIAFQSNAEHELIEQIHAAKAAGIGGILVNPGAFTPGSSGE